MAWARDETYAEAFQVVDGAPQRAKLDLAAAATAGVEMQDRQAATQPGLPAIVQPARQRRRSASVHRGWLAGDRTSKQRTDQAAPQHHRSTPELDRPNEARISRRSSI